MSRFDDDRLDDIPAAFLMIAKHLERGGLNDGLVFDAVRMRLVEIGEAVKNIDPKFLAAEDTVPWADIAGMRDRLAHHYFDTSFAVIQATLEEDLPRLRSAVRRLRHSS